MQIESRPPSPGEAELVTLERDTGMATAEYAIATLAACGFAALLVAILSGGDVKSLLMGIITKALNLG